MEALLDPTQLKQARAALLADDSADLIDFVFRLNLGQPVVDAPAAARQRARELGWVEAESDALSKLGHLVADPVREYRFWLDRDRRLHGEAHCELLQPTSYAGKHVLEPGSGFGCNLFSLAPHAERIVGLEPVGLYLQFTDIFAEREGIAPPEVHTGQAESMPFADAEFDVIVCYSSHQYMDLRRAFAEMARVLRPGGQLQIIGGTLDVFRKTERPRGLGARRDYLLTVLNTLSYERFGRRLLTPPGRARTTAPIYPRPVHLDRWLAKVGLRTRPELRARVDVETLTVAEKPRS